MIPFSSQVNRILFNKRSFSFLKSSENQMKVVYPLENRGLVKVSGPEAAPFLQGLITNDMSHFETGAQSLYAMFLSNKGRVLYDTLVHKWGPENDNTFMLECDKSIQHLLQKHLKVYKLRRPIKIEDVNEMHKLWAFITPPDFNKDCCETDTKHNLSVYKDPRLAELGHRLITTPDMSHVDIRQAIGEDIVIKNNEEEYQALRYKLGVSEGAEDLFPGTCFPLEANCDYLHGVSFHKGCYIGQELTARVHHTGVIRKRIMPLLFLDIKKEEELQKDAIIWAENENGKTNLGKFKAHAGGFGLGLVRIKEALEAKSLYLGENQLEVVKPHWWPVEAPKEKLNVLKSENEPAPSPAN